MIRTITINSIVGDGIVMDAILNGIHKLEAQTIPAARGLAGQGRG